MPLVEVQREQELDRSGGQILTQDDSNTTFQVFGDEGDTSRAILHTLLRANGTVVSARASYAVYRLA